MNDGKKIMHGDDAEIRLSIIIPTLNDCAELGPTLDGVEAALAKARGAVEVIVVDGGGSDGAIRLIENHERFHLIHCEAGRARQMNTGARRARGSWLFFLHCDTRIEEDLLAGIEHHLDGDIETLFTFTLRFRNDAPYFRRMERGVQWRNRRLGWAYGDQGYCMHRNLFDQMGGFREDVELEDLDFILRLRSHGKLKLLPEQVYTSTRQYDRQGWFWATAYNIGRLSVGVARYLLKVDARRMDGGERGSMSARRPD